MSVYHIPGEGNMRVMIWIAGLVMSGAMLVGFLGLGMATTRIAKPEIIKTDDSGPQVVNSSKKGPRLDKLPPVKYCNTKCREA